jgi:hypothetical protein
VFNLSSSEIVPETMNTNNEFQLEVLVFNMKDLWQVYFVIHTWFQIPCVLARNEYAELSKDVNMWCGSLIGLYIVCWIGLSLTIFIVVLIHLEFVLHLTHFVADKSVYTRIPSSSYLFLFVESLIDP